MHAIFDLNAKTQDVSLIGSKERPNDRVSSFQCFEARKGGVDWVGWGVE